MPPESPVTPQEKPELLAPAGRAETFFAALDAGADAVYAGLQDFNARLRAPNFTLEELSPLIAFAHEHGRKVYVTLNTLIKEHELPEVARVLDALRRIGPDALIVQDLGVYRLARELAPEIPLHASTQMTIHNLDGALQLQRMGFQRVILARELTLEEIRAIRSSSTIALETFIHGALCFSISGQCLFSSYLHGKSANRGGCMQPCRRMFEYSDREGPFFSTYDLNTAAILDQLIASGIRSFKIEGRLKPAETIAQIVRAYRILIDAYPRVSREAVAEARRALDVAVGRAPSTGFYLSARPDRIVGGNVSHAALDLGVALSAGPRRFALVSRNVVKTGDRLRVQVSEKETPRGFVVREMRDQDGIVKRSRPGQRVEIVAPFDVPPGARVLKVADTDAMVKGAARRCEKRHAAATKPSRAAVPARFFPVDARTVRIETRIGTETTRLDWPLTWKGSVSGPQAARTLSDESGGFEVRLAVDARDFGSEDIPLAEEDLAALRKRALLGVTETLDRQCTRVLEAMREGAVEEGESPETARCIIRVSTVETAAALVAALDEKLTETSFVLSLSQVETEAFRQLRARKDVAPSIILALPPFMFQPEKRAETAGLLRRAIDMGVNRFEASNLAHFNLLQATGRRLQVFTGMGIGCLNSQCHAQLREMGATVVTYSIEGDLENLRRLAARAPKSALAVQVYGRIPLFQSRVPRRFLPSGAVRLADAGSHFTVRMQDGVTSVMPRETFSLLDRLDLLRELGLRSFVYEVSHEDDPVAVMQGCQKKDRPAAQAISTFNFERGLT